MATRIRLELATLDARTVATVLTGIANHNARWLARHVATPLLYDSGVRYVEERRERWADLPTILASIERGEDCDSLAAWRAGELVARGAQALRPGEPGHDDAIRLALPSIRAQVSVAVTDPGPPLLHAFVTYEVDGRVYHDDPSTRLGMWGRVADDVTARWAAAGVSPNSR